MRRHERIPIHDHSDINSGGLVAASTVVLLGAGESVAASASAASVTATDVPISDTAGLFTATNVETALAELATVPVEVVALSGTALTLDYATAQWWDITLSANCALTITNPPADQTAGVLTVILRQDGTGSRTVTWPASVDWPDTDGTGGGSAPTLYTAAGAQDVIVLTTVDAGLTWGGSYDSKSAGVAGTAVTSETTLGLSSTAGTATAYAREDHTHGSPPASAISAAGFVGQLLIADVHSTPIVFADLITNEATDDLLYADI